MSYCSYENVIAGLHERLATVAGLSAETLLDYEPTVIQDTPLVYTLLDRFKREQAGQITAMHYRIVHRLVIQWQDNEQAEQQLKPFVNAIPAAIDADPTLGGRIRSGLARVSDAESGFLKISNTTYRILDIYVDVLTKAPVRSGI